MTLSGGCYCGEVRYEVTAEPVLNGQCHCRPCQHISGGGPNYYMLIPPEGFSFTAGKPKAYSRPDLANAVTRESALPAAPIFSPEGLASGRSSSRPARSMILPPTGGRRWRYSAPRWRRSISFPKAFPPSTDCRIGDDEQAIADVDGRTRPAMLACCEIAAWPALPRFQNADRMPSPDAS